MITRKYDDLSMMLSQYKFDIDLDTLDNIRCDICKGILKKAMQSICGCSFCFECILKYLGNDSKPCPNSNVCGSNEFLNLEGDIQIDHRINKNILNLIVNCPHDKCFFKDKLVDISTHIRICEKKEIKCPYTYIGCDEININKDTLTVHLREKIYNHSNMVTESIKNINNQLLLIKDMKEEIIAIEAIEKTLQQQVDDQKIEIETLKLQNLHLSETLENLVNAKKGLFDENVINRINQLEITMGRMTGNCMKTDDFVWTVEDFSLKQKGFLPKYMKEITSRSFYTHKEGYRMRLKLYPNGYGRGLSTHLCVSFSIMRGDFDDKLDWPFIHTVILSCINQHTNKDYLSRSFHYDSVSTELKGSFLKPKTQMNKAVGDDEFISLDHLFSESGLLKNDSLMIRCVTRNA